jgi:hypothetical protein
MTKYDRLLVSVVPNDASRVTKLMLLRRFWHYLYCTERLLLSVRLDMASTQWNANKRSIDACLEAGEVPPLPPPALLPAPRTHLPATLPLVG